MGLLVRPQEMLPHGIPGFLGTVIFARVRAACSVTSFWGPHGHVAYVTVLFSERSHLGTLLGLHLV